MDSDEFLILSSDYIKKRYLEDTYPKQVHGFLLSEPKFDWNLITELDLSSSNIVHIFGLRLVTNLKRLRMAQNHIMQITNLEWLINLEHLDLSYNKISKIENLDRLTALNFLNLGGNKISVLENLDENSQIETFIINDNEITDINQIYYLKRFKYLLFLDVLNNPAMEDARQLIIEQFPNLQYLNTERIIRPSTTSPEDKHDHLDAKISREETNKRLAFLNDTDGKQFIRYLFQGDDEGVMLSKWNATVQTAFAIYKKEITKNAVKMYNKSLKKLAFRDEKYFYFNIANNEFKKKWMNISRDIIEEYEEIRCIRMQNIDDELYDDSVNGSSNTQMSSDLGPNENMSTLRQGNLSENLLAILEEEIMALSYRLHEINIYMNKSILEMIGKYEKIMDDDLKLYLESLIPIFFNMREVENTYSQILIENVKMAINNPQRIIPSIYLRHFENKLAISQATYKSTDKHLDKIFKREEKINSDARNWTKQNVEDLRMAERRRFWMIFEEIVSYRYHGVLWFKSFF